MTNGAENNSPDEMVLVLIRDEDFIRIDDRTIEIVPGFANACRLDGRLILSDDLRYTYLIERIEPAKTPGWLRVDSRRGRPITNSAYVHELLARRQ